MVALAKYYVSVTGLITKGWLSIPKFLYLSSRAYHDALKADGNIKSSMFSKDGVQHTITVWKSREAMQNFMFSGAHLDCMKNMKVVSKYAKAYGYYSDEIPTTTQAIDEWEKEGRRVFGEPKADCGDLDLSTELKQ